MIDHMKTLGVFDVKTRLSSICEEVAKSGESVLVTRRGKPLVRITPVAESTCGSEVWEAREAYASSEYCDDFPAVRRETEPPYQPFSDEDR
jgi:prevent-host-death family protein